METTNDRGPERNGNPQKDAPIDAKCRKLHLLAVARRRQGLSVRCIASRLNCSTNQVRAQERESADMWLSELYRWRAALEVPIQELVEEPDESLAIGIGVRAQLLRLMKTARSLQASVRSKKLSRLSHELVHELIEVMPELKEIPAWPSVGQRRTSDEYGRTAIHTIPENSIHGAVT